jgi:HAD superfamily hydrolase (TIGR01509 family)
VLKAIIFDVDGTLAETEEVHRAAFNSAFADAGLSWHWSETLYGELLKVTGGKERLAHFIEAMGGVGLSVPQVNRLIADLHRRKTAIYAEMIASGAVGLRPGVAELIEGALGQNIRLAIATTTSRPNVDALLRSAMGGRDIAAFEVIAAGDSAPRKKPAPDIFIATLKQLGLPARDCLAIEDSENGLRSAMSAGLPVLITPSYYSGGENFAGAAAVAEALPELAEAPARNDCRLLPAALVDAVRALHRDAVAELRRVGS